MNKMYTKGSVMIRPFFLAIVMLLQLCVSVQAQKKIKTQQGVVIDRVSGSAISNVSIYNQSNPKKITFSNNEGSFQLAVKSSDVVIFLHPNYENYRLVIQKGLPDTLKLRPKDKKDSETIIVAGYKIWSKENSVGAIAVPDLEELKVVPVPSLTDALSGRLAGVNVSKDEGQPGMLSNLSIRGLSTLTLNTNPLYVVNGFPIANASPDNLNVLDIKSITILKDGALLAMYGARATNGVVMIETKQGSSLKPIIEYQANAGVSQVTKTMDMMEPYDFVKYQLEQNPTLAESIYGGVSDLFSYRNQTGEDWQDKVYRSAFLQTHHLSLSGKSAQTKYYFSGSVFNQDGVVRNSGYSRYQGKAGLQQAINKEVSIGVDLNYSVVNNYGQLSSTPQLDEKSYSTYLMYSLLGYKPVVGVRENFDLQGSILDPTATDLRVNPYLSVINADRKSRRKNLLVNSYLAYDISGSLQLKIKGGINSTTNRNINFNNNLTRAGIKSPENPGGVSSVVNYYQFNDWYNENTLSYKKMFGPNNRLDIIAGAAIQGTNTKIYGLTSTDIKNPLLGSSGLDDGLGGPAISDVSGNKILSFFGNASYELNSKYFITAVLRADGLSKFSPKNQWGYFPGMAFSWKMNKESFMKELKFISESKLRLSYGHSGNSSISDYARFSAVGIATYYSYNNLTPVGSTQVLKFGNDDLTFERTVQTNIGYDLGLFKNRIYLSADLYRKTSDDVLVMAAAPSTSGFATILQNAAKIRNQGLELTLNTANIVGKSFSWNTDFNISFNQNKLISLSSAQDDVRSGMVWNDQYKDASLYRAVPGGSVADFYGYTFDGVYQYADFDEIGGTYLLKSIVTTNGNDRSVIQPGDIKYRDLNGDLTVDEKDQTKIGRALPIHTGGFNNRFRYKQFGLSVLFQWSYGNDIFNANRLVFEGNVSNDFGLNQYASYNNSWTPANQNNSLFRIGGQGPANSYSSRVVENGSYLRLKTVNFSYVLTDKLVKRMNMQSVELFVAALNLLTFTKYSGMDPEVAVHNSALTPGFDYSAYPQSKSITIGLRASF